MTVGSATAPGSCAAANSGNSEQHTRLNRAHPQTIQPPCASIAAHGTPKGQRKAQNVPESSDNRAAPMRKLVLRRLERRTGEFGFEHDLDLVADPHRHGGRGNAEADAEVGALELAVCREADACMRIHRMSRVAAVIARIERHWLCYAVQREIACNAK